MQGYCSASESRLPRILWIYGFATTITANIFLAAALNPVVFELSHMPRLNLPTLAQASALGLDIGGNATLVGVSGNVKKGSRLFIQE